MKANVILVLVGSMLLAAGPCVAQGALGTFGPGLSPSRQFRAYIETGPESDDLFIRDLGTFRRTNLTNNDLDEANPSWSLDSSRIAFNVNQANGDVDVYVVDVDGNGIIQLTSGGGKHMRPFWLASGEVGYTDETGAESRVVYIDKVSGEATDMHVGMFGPTGQWRSAALEQPGIVKAVRDGIVPSTLAVTYYYTKSESVLVRMTGDGFGYCPAKEIHYKNSSSSASITWGENRAMGSRGNAWTILWTGLVYLPAGQAVTFTIDHDQRVYLWVDSTELFATNSSDGHAKVIQVTAVLAAGVHSIDFAYFDDYEGGGHLEVSWESDEMPRETLGSMVAN